MSLISKFLSRFNVRSEDELSDDEKATLARYKRILSDGEVTIDKIKEFCDNQIEILHANCDGKTPLTPIQQASLHIYLNIRKAIVSPQAERAALEQHLQSIIDEKSQV